jgi:hypothetical protein
LFNSIIYIIDAGYRVSGDTDINYLVLQMHYKDKFDEGQYDESGLDIEFTSEK